ncbi:MAG: OmpA family protein [Endomicrobia bacterium]|nr:OmpA family protein [Endomicrobiia bacterium]MCL2507179.1 OmpA family protein [Endomicrobiia bacterium]
MRLRHILSALIFFFLFSSAYAFNAYADFFPPYAKYNRINAADQETGMIAFKAELTFDHVFHKLGENWVVSPDALGINKIFNYKPSLNPDNRWEDTYGQTLFFNLGLKPFDWLFAEFGFHMIADYADRYWIPVNEEHRLEITGNRFPRIAWQNARIGLKLDWMSLTYHKNYAHLGWVYDGDMFEMFPRQDAPDDYLRFSGHHTPDFWQFKTSGFFGDIDAIYGEEAVQDYKQGIYIKYKNIFGSNINFFYSDHIIPFGKPEERMRNFQLNTDFTFWEGSNFQIGGLYRPFRLDWEYNYVDNVGLGNGEAGSKYIEKFGTTGQSDAFGGSAKLTLPKKFGLDNIIIGGDYRGLVAGNRWKAEASIEKQITDTMNTYLGYYYQKPLLRSMPLVYARDSVSPPTIFQGRGPESPFWVWWRNPITGFDNRETSNFSFVFTYDPTPSTWFYAYDPHDLSLHNLNPEEDAPFSFAVRLNLAKYFGSLDRQIYWEYDGNTAWEDSFSNGTNAPNRYIGSLYFLGQFIKDEVRVIYDFEVGEDLATLSYAYPDRRGDAPREIFLKPMIGYFKTSLTVKTDPYLFKVGYNKNYWGPEDWHRNFGSSYDELYLAHASRDIGEWFNVGVEYAGARKTEAAIINELRKKDQENNEYFTINEMGYFDEIRVYVKVFLDALFKFGEKEREGLPFDVEHYKMPPDIALKTKPDTIYPAQGQRATLEPWAYSPAGISHWELLIKDPEGNVVKTYTGEKEPPEELFWNGKNENSGQICPNGPYYATLQAWDNYNNTAFSPTRIINVMTEIEEAKVEETERGLVITLGAKVLFDFDKFNLKKGAKRTLEEVANLLKMYPDNDISIEGHTDWKGSIAYNQILSENRAKSVRDFFIKEGIAPERLKIVGFGKLRPIASNETDEGRDQNRRVEIVVLNAKPVAVDELPVVSSEHIKMDHQETKETKK